MSLLSAKNLKKQFKQKAVVNDVSLDIHSGSCIGLLGPNGAGKTTCFYMIVGLQSCDEGRILLDHHDISSWPIHLRARKGISYLPQEPSIFRKLSVEDNLKAILELRPELTHSAQQHELAKLLEEFRISHLAKQLGLSLSGGERRRVEIARALATNPKFILLDEPFAGVDPISVLDIKSMIQQLCSKNIGVLITDHNVRETLEICDRAYIVSQGRVLCEGTSDDILNNKTVRSVYLGDEFTL